MNRLPPELLTYVLDQSLYARNPFYLRIGRDLRLLDFSGDNRLYGIPQLEPGLPVVDQVHFLTGLIPLKEYALTLPCVQIEDGRWADILIMKDGRHHWVLFLALTDEMLRNIHLQEKADEYHRLLQKQNLILDQYLGKELVRALENGMISTRQSGEHREVSILFVDIRGYSTFSENHPPEIAFATLNQYLDTMIKPLLEESAVVDKIIGDAVMGVFGILTVSVSPPHQAFMAAMKILDKMRTFNKERAHKGLPVLEVGIGISTGPVAVGVLGSSNRKSFSVVGHHVNLAARLQDIAKPFEILVDENTYREIIAYQQSFQTLEIKLKGMRETVKIYSFRHT